MAAADRGRMYDDHYEDAIEGSNANLISGDADVSPAVSASETGRGQSNRMSSSTVPKAVNDVPQQLAVVPLHPACKKQRLEAKQLPIVLGRTNLASWWWKSCPCQHYCRLHCRPVAQNIRSLSKVMIQIDTAGRIHMCGKNPHLVTIIPERHDRYLQVNDIISIGRRDREPWMRLQVVQKPSRKQLLSARKSKTHTPEWMARQNNHHHHRKSSSSINNNNNNNNNNSSNVNNSNHGSSSLNNNNGVASSNNNNNVNAPNPNNAVEAVNNNAGTTNNNNNSNSRQQNQSTTNHNQGNKNRNKDDSSNNTTSQNPAVSNPPEWITTTRKRKSSRRGVNTMKLTSNSNNGDSDSPPRKRSRRSDKRQRRKSSEDADAGNNNNGGGAQSSSLVEKDHHPQVHLVFQDYETSATLLRGLQRKKRRSKGDRGRNDNNSASGSGGGGGSGYRSNFLYNSNNPAAAAAAVAANNGSSNSSIISGSQNKKQKTFVADKSQLKLLSRSFAAALRGEMPSNNYSGQSEDELDSKPAAIVNDNIATASGIGDGDGDRKKKKKQVVKRSGGDGDDNVHDKMENDAGVEKDDASFLGNIPEGAAESKVSSESIDAQKKKVGEDDDSFSSRREAAAAVVASGSAESPPTSAPKNDDENHGVSLLSLPQCAVSSAGSSASPSSASSMPGPLPTTNRSINPQYYGDGNNINNNNENSAVASERASNPQQPDDADNASSSSDGIGKGEIVDGEMIRTNSNNNNNDNDDDDDESEYTSTPGSRDPTTDLERWREIIQNEEAKGNGSSFRHALASLVVAKNEKSGGRENGLLWLPPLLENVGNSKKPQASRKEP